MKLYTMTTYYVANVLLDTIAETLEYADIAATLTPCEGVSLRWGREPTVAIMVVSDNTGQVRKVIAGILRAGSESCALVISSNGFISILNNDGSLSEPE